MKSITFLCAMVMMSLPMCGQYVSEVWSPDNHDGTYTNPVINADYSDPDICVGASGRDYYLTASSFQAIPGLPILHSQDLVNWEIIGHAITQLLPAEVYDKPAHGMGVWAPSIRYHAGEYYIYWGDPDYGVFMVKTKDPAGRWDDPICVIAGKGMIDTTPLWDDDGRCYLVNGWAASRSQFNSVLSVRELSADGTRAISSPVIVYDGNNANHTTEGPKFYKRNGWYWIMCPAGGVEQGWQLAMRAKNPYGPYECTTVMAQGNSNINGPHQGGWVHTAYDEDWFVHFQDKGCYGRVVHLQPVTWKDNWPVIGKVPAKGYCGQPYTVFRKPKSDSKMISNPIESDEFNTTTLGLQWQWQANYNQLYGMPTAMGVFRLYTNKLSKNFINLWEAPNLLLQKTPADNFTATASITFAAKKEGQYGGIIMMGRDYSALVVKRVGEAFQLEQLTCQGADRNKNELAEVLTTLQPTEKDKIDYNAALYCTLYLRMKIQHPGILTYSYSTDGKHFTSVGKSFKMREGKWIGAKMGFVAEEPYGKGNSGYLDIDWIRITK